MGGREARRCVSKSSKPSFGAACLRRRLASGVSVHQPQSNAAFGIGCRMTRHPQRGNCRAPWGALGFTCVNILKIISLAGSLLQTKTRVDVGRRRARCGALSCKRVESKGSRLNGHPGALTRVASAAVAVKGLRFASMNALESGAPLTAILAAAVFQL